MRRLPTIISVLLAVLAPSAARGAEFTFSTHLASGSGSANVFDGGAVVSDSATLTDPTSAEFGFAALDLTRPGSSGASAIAFGNSSIIEFEQGIRLLVEFRAVYDPSPFPGGDRPGGMAEGNLSSVIDFVMPVDTLDWSYRLLVDDTIGFDGSTSIVIENITHPETILTLTEQVAANTVLMANAGDLIRITSEISGGGSARVGSTRQYGGDLAMTFTIPEPSTVTLLTVALFAIARRRRVCRSSDLCAVASADREAQKPTNHDEFGIAGSAFSTNAA